MISRTQSVPHPRVGQSGFSPAGHNQVPPGARQECQTPAQTGFKPGGRRTESECRNEPE